MSEPKLTIAGLIEQNIEIMSNVTKSPSDFKIVKRYKFNDSRVSSMEELEHITSALYQSFDLIQLLHKTGLADWAIKGISFNAVGLPRVINQLEDITQVSLGIALKEDHVNVVVNYKFDTGKDYTYSTILQIG